MKNSLKIFIGIVVIIVVCILVCTFKFRFSKEKTTQNIEGDKQENEYVSNNKYNSKFNIYDIDKCELATYDKFSKLEAQEKILNQFIKVEIKNLIKIEEINQNSAIETKTEYVFLLEDYESNKWICKSNRDLQDNSYNIKIKNNLICYGKYIGIEKYQEQEYPKIEISYIYKDIDRLDTNKLTSIGNNFIDNLNTNYFNEKFEFKEIKKDTGYDELIYINSSDTLEISLIIDENKIKMSNLNIKTIKSDVDKIDQEFLKTFILSFNSNIENKDVSKYLEGAKSKQKEFNANVYKESYKSEPYEYKGIISDRGITNSSLLLYYSK